MLSLNIDMNAPTSILAIVALVLSCNLTAQELDAHPARAKTSSVEVTRIPLAQSLDTQSRSIACLQFLSGSQHLVLASGDNGAFTLWDLYTKSAVWSANSDQSDVTALACSVDGHIAAGRWNGAISIYDRDGKPQSTLRGHTESITSLAFSADGKRLVSGSCDDSLRIWDARSGIALHTFDSGNEYDVTAVAFSADGSCVAGGDGENTVRVWDAKSGEELHVLRGHESVVSSVSFSADGKSLVTGSWDQSVLLWDLGTEQVQHAMKGHVDEIVSVVFTAAGTVSSASTDGNLRTWQSGKSAEAFSLQDGPGRFGPVAFSEDGKSIAAASKGRIYLWKLPSSVQEVSSRK